MGNKHKGIHDAADFISKAKHHTGEMAAKPILIVGGLILGNLVGKMVDKFVTVDPAAEGFQMKSLAKPIVQALVGMPLIYFTSEDEKDEGTTAMLKSAGRSIGYGIAGASLISTAKLFKKDLFEGLGDTGIGSIGAKSEDVKYYREAKEDYMKLLQDNAFRPALSSTTSGFGETTEEDLEGMSAMDSDEDSEISGLNMSDSAGEIL